MWLGEQINEYGIGNGISLLIFGGIVARNSQRCRSIMAEQVLRTDHDHHHSYLFIVFALLVIVGVIVIQQGTRRSRCSTPRES